MILKGKNIIKRSLAILSALFLVASVNSCEQFELPEAGSIADLTPPTADFSYTSTTAGYKNIQFSNLSISANDFTWDFGDGKTSTDANPLHVFTDGEGTYSVKLISKDGNGVTDVVSKDVEVVNVLVPAFLCPSFECSDRSVWGSYSGSGSPTPPDGAGGAKFSANSSSNYLDQTIKVTAKTKYQVSFWYVSKSSGTHAGKLLIEDGDDNSIVYVQENLALSPDASNYIKVIYTITMNKATDNLRFSMKPGDVEARFDLVEIVKV